MAEKKGKKEAKTDAPNNQAYDVVWDLIKVDICKGINELKRLKDPKLNGEQKKELTIAAYEHSGIKIVYEKLIKGEVGVKNNKTLSGFLKNVVGDQPVNILVEYSLLPSTLDPKDPNKLMCCSFLVENDGDGKFEFKRRVEAEYTKCIEKTAEEKKISIYQHPNFLYDIPTENSENRPAFDKNYCNVIYQNLGITITRKITYSLKDTQNSSSNKNSNELSGHYTQVPAKDNLFIESFSLDRVYQELVSDAKNAVSSELSDVQSYLHNCCHNSISRTTTPVTSYYISFPIIGSRASNQLQRYRVGELGESGEFPLQGIGACFMYLEISGMKLIDEEVIQATKVFCQHMGGFIRFISSNYVFNLGLQLQENARKEALKSAKAAIMSRNMSHNLGSHVMSYLKQHLSSVNSIMDNKVLAEIYTGNDDIPSRLKEKDGKIEEKVAMPFLTGLGQFISYLQERQDFIATIATDFIPYNSNVNFKDHIYDELNPDKRYERHKSESKLRKRIDNILLGYIARSEGLGRQPSLTDEESGSSNTVNNELNDIVLKFRNFNGNKANSAGEERDLKIMRDLDVALPGGVVGRQAFFSIIENVIRNAAKHGHWKDSKKLELTFDYYTNKTRRDAPDGDNYDNNHKSLRSVLNDLYTPAVDSDDLYFFTLTDNSETKLEVLEKLRKAIAEEYVKSTGELMDGNKGIKEMRISASWLRSLSSDYIPVIEGFSKKELLFDKDWKLDEKSHAPILYVRLSRDNESVHLQYIFCLIIPKKIAIISPALKQMSKVENCCGLFSSVDAFLEQNDTSYEFIIFDDRKESYSSFRKNQEQYQWLRRNSSSRVIKLLSLSNKTLIELIAGVIEEGKTKKRVVNDVELLLLEHLAKDDNDEDSDKKDYILIQDDAPRISRGIRSMVGKDSPSGERNIYVYRSHHETEAQFKGYFDAFSRTFQNVAFVEGITGDNSTDRLIRRTDINREWFFRHLHVMKSNVAIIDERLFHSIFGLEEDDLKIRPVDKSSESTMNQAFRILKSRKKNHGNEVQIKAQLKPECAAKDFKPTVLWQKGVYVFNFVQNEERPHEFVLYGIKKDSFTDIRERLNHDSNGYRSTCVQLLTLSWNDVKRELSITPSNEWKKSYMSEDMSKDMSEDKKKDKNKDKDKNKNMKLNYLSIHQGILDKLYGAFGIDKEDADTKEILTKTLYEFFFEYKKTDIIPFQNKKKFFLPGMCIHSGRSKPDRGDMPQHLPFIQYAAIEHAALDSKYSLVELLDFARYQNE